MNEYNEALNQLRVFEREYNFKIQGQVAPQENCDILQELVEKATPKKPINQVKPVVRMGNCPNCKGEIIKLGSRPCNVIEGQLFCCDCGQALDWSGEDDD